MSASRTVDSPTLDLREVEGVLDTDERVLNTEAARQLFMRRLGNVMALGQCVSSIQQDADGVRVDGKRYDFVVDATWGHLTRPDVPLFYEPTMLLYYEGPLDHPALTMVDGPLCSVYPTEDPKVYTLSSVTHTPLGQTDSAAQAR
ncbi:MAG: FAD-dependent oxidoreductase, partial [Uliginosibacterium sp.]|nr:FAD-dependent oxidoreductase [Uliginosibacterium sp.]